MVSHIFPGIWKRDLWLELHTRQASYFVLSISLATFPFIVYNSLSWIMFSKSFLSRRKVFNDFTSLLSFAFSFLIDNSVGCRILDWKLFRGAHLVVFRVPPCSVLEVLLPAVVGGTLLSGDWVQASCTQSICLAQLGMENHFCTENFENMNPCFLASYAAARSGLACF